MASHKKRIADIRNHLQPVKVLVDDTLIVKPSDSERVLHPAEDAQEGLKKVLEELDALEQELDNKE